VSDWVSPRDVKLRLDAERVISLGWDEGVVGESPSPQDAKARQREPLPSSDGPFSLGIAVRWDAFSFLSVSENISYECSWLNLIFTPQINCGFCCTTSFYNAYVYIIRKKVMSN